MEQLKREAKIALTWPLNLIRAPFTNKRSNLKVREKQIVGAQPKPLSARRLSSSIRHDVDNQASPLLRLPREIRDQIITLVLGEGLLHLLQLPRGLGHIRCTCARDSDPGRMCFPTGTVQTYQPFDLTRHPSSTDDCISLLQVCRQLHQEAGQILYATNAFEINHPTTLILLAKTITPQNLKTIRRLQIVWNDPARWYFNNQSDYDAYLDDFGTWERMWECIGEEMTGLRRLELFVKGNPSNVTYWRCSPDEFLEKVLNAPRARLRGLEDFSLEASKNVQWDWKEEERKMREIVCKVG